MRIDDFKYRFTDQPGGWLGATIKVDWPILVNLRLDPFERTGMPDGATVRWPTTIGSPTSSGASCLCSRRSARPPRASIEFPPMQKGASFNLEAVKAQIEKAIAAHAK